MANLEEAFVRVLATGGAFKSEYAVQIKSYDGKDVSLFADREEVQERQGDYYLVVHVLKDIAKGDKKRLLLPSETFETSSRWVDVNESDVKEALAL